MPTFTDRYKRIDSIHARLLRESNSRSENLSEAFHLEVARASRHEPAATAAEAKACLQIVLLAMGHDGEDQTPEEILISYAIGYLSRAADIEGRTGESGASKFTFS